MLNAGDTAPDFVLPDDAGGTRSLSALRGRAVVLYFYPKDDTSGCTAEAESFSALRAEFDAARIEVFGISPDSVASHEKFRRKYGLNVRLLSDAARTTAEQYGVWVEKSMYGRRYMGIQRSTFLIDPSGRIVRIWHKVKVPGHAAEVLAVAQALPH